jgi:integrase
MAPATINHLCRCVCAALALAAQHDERIQNRAAWENGLASLPDAQEARNGIISDDKVREFVATAYGLDDKFGLLADTLAITGARPSQVVRLLVRDFDDHPMRPRLLMPKSGRGGGRNRAQKKAERYSVPITVQLAARLKLAAKGRAGEAPLLLQSDGTLWDKNLGQKYHRWQYHGLRPHRVRNHREMALAVEGGGATDQPGEALVQSRDGTFLRELAARTRSRFRGLN